MEPDISFSTRSMVSRNNHNESSFNGFKIAQDRLSATKTIVLSLEDGTKKDFVFTIIFKSQTKSPQETLKKYTDSKLEILGKMSVELGCGKTFESLKFQNNSSNSKLILNDKNGNVKVIDPNSEAVKEDDKLYLRMFKTIECVANSLQFKPESSDETHLDQKIQDLRKKIIEKINYSKRNLQNLYTREGVKVSIYYEEFYNNLQKNSINSLREFIERAKTFKE